MTQQSPPPGGPDEPTARRPAVPPPHPATPEPPPDQPAVPPPHPATPEPPPDQPEQPAQTAVAAPAAAAGPPRRPWRTRRVPVLLAAAMLVLGCFLGASAVAAGAVVVNLGDDHDHGPRISRDAREGRIGDREHWRPRGEGRPALPPHRREPGGTTPSLPAPVSPVPATPAPSSS